MNIGEKWQETPFWQKLFLTLLVSGIAVYLIYLALIESKKEEYNSLQLEVDKLESQVEILRSSVDPKIVEKLNQKIKQLRIENEQKLAKIQQYKSAIPPEPEIEKVLYFIAQSAYLSGVKLNSFKVEKEEDVKLFYDKNENTLKVLQQDGKNQPAPENVVHLKRVYIQSGLTGDINGIFRFMDNFSKSERVISIDKLEIKRESNKLNNSLSFSVYYGLEEN